MKGLKNNEELQLAIMELTVKRNRERDALIQQWNEVKVEFTPANLLKDGVKDAFSNSDIKSGLLKSLLSLGAGFLTRNLIMGSTPGLVGKVVGTLAQTGATSLAYKSTDKLKEKGAPILSKFLKKLKIGE
ncbi:hypothetical protein [Flavobacterium silvaticum]|uniref:Uncharacterized protein n=1 Tax=Flavobacterium silvaticum TaxID=1852020 RepID=A0A972JGC9_9FLAO|nr:hypothetical protein [Flavobacterium silvaticum]NMH28919.1 hypothetical protein [Flavobacterium silvaticum]